jgi:hypothetical protein
VSAWDWVRSAAGLILPRAYFAPPALSALWYPCCQDDGTTDCEPCPDDKMPAGIRAVFGGSISGPCANCNNLLATYDLMINAGPCRRTYALGSSICEVGQIWAQATDQPAFEVYWLSSGGSPWVQWKRTPFGFNCLTHSGEPIPYWVTVSNWDTNYCDASGVTCTVSALAL